MMNSVPIVTVDAFELQICRYRLWLPLGWTDLERQTPQPVELDLSIALPTSPLASQTDQLQDTFCYAALLDKLATMSDNPCKLLEHVAERVLNTAAQFLQEQGYFAQITVGVTKVLPPVKDVLGGVKVIRRRLILGEQR